MTRPRTTPHPTQPPAPAGRRFVALLLLAFAFSTTLFATPTTQTQAATVYRTVDANGTVSFSDQPPPANQPTGTIELPESAPAGDQDAGSETQAAGTRDRNSDRGESWDWDLRGAIEGGGFQGYASVTLLTPAADAAIRANDGLIDINLDLAPSLQPGHTIEILLDGQLAADTTEPATRIADVSRGTHTLTARVVNADGQIMGTSETISIHVQRYAPLMAPNRPKPAPAGN